MKYKVEIMLKILLNTKYWDKHWDVPYLKQSIWALHVHLNVKWCYRISVMNYLKREIFSAINGIVSKYVLMGLSSYSLIWLWGFIKGLLRGRSSAHNSWDPAGPDRIRLGERQNLSLAISSCMSSSKKFKFVFFWQKKKEKKRKITY